MQLASPQSVVIEHDCFAFHSLKLTFIDVRHETAIGPLWKLQNPRHDSKMSQRGMIIIRQDYLNWRILTLVLVICPYVCRCLLIITATCF